jgi:carbamate kinase
MGAESKRRLVVVAVGGNSLIIDNKHEAIPDQATAAAKTVHHLIELFDQGWNVVLTHGNGPQVGFILRRSEIALGEVPPVPMDYAGADTQGAIGYMFQRALDNKFRRRGVDKKAVTVVTQVLVDRNDPAFKRPTKPIGSFMDEATAHEIGRTQGWIVAEDSGRGWRRMVPSPKPTRIVELDAIASLLDQGFAVVACGGGGIPIIEDENGNYIGVEAVIDKDLSSSLLARELGAEKFVISTDVPKVALNFNQRNQKWLDRIILSEARRFSAEGHFDSGSMGPKVRAMIEFVEARGGEGIITNPPNILNSLSGKAGTRIVID